MDLFIIIIYYWMKFNPFYYNDFQMHKGSYSMSDILDSTNSKVKGFWKRALVVVMRKSFLRISSLAQRDIISARSASVNRRKLLLVRVLAKCRV